MATTWSPVNGRGRSVVSTQTSSESAPTLFAEGLNLNDVGGFSIFLVCDEGETFTVASDQSTPRYLAGYVWSGVEEAWARAPDLDCDIAAEHLGQRRIAFTGFTVANPVERVAHVATDIAVSGGGLTVRYECTDLSGRRI